MQLDFKYQVLYTNKRIIPVNLVSNSLIANETLVKNVDDLLGEILPGLKITNLQIKFEEAYHKSPLKEVFGLSLFMTFQDELTREVPELIEKLIGLKIPDSYDTIVTIAVFLLMYQTIEFAFKKFLSDKKSKKIENNFKLLLNTASEYFGISSTKLRDSIKSFFEKKEKTPLVYATRDFLAPARLEFNSEIIGGIKKKLVVPNDVLSEFPDNLIIAESDEEKEEIYKGVNVEIRATDKDKNKMGWAAVVRIIANKRLKMSIGANINLEALFKRDIIFGDVIAKYKLNNEGDWQPYLITLIKVYDNNEPERSDPKKQN